MFCRSADAWIMAKHQPKKLPRDVNSRANAIGKIATGETVLPEESADGGKNPAAVALGRLGGAKGGKARAAKMTKAQRSASAKKAVAARWARKKGGQDHS
jgi:hypothetical protein